MSRAKTGGVTVSGYSAAQVARALWLEHRIGQIKKANPAGYRKVMALVAKLEKGAAQ